MPIRLRVQVILYGWYATISLLLMMGAGGPAGLTAYVFNQGESANQKPNVASSHVFSTLHYKSTDATFVVLYYCFCLAPNLAPPLPPSYSPPLISLADIPSRVHDRPVAISLPSLTSPPLPKDLSVSPSLPAALHPRFLPSLLLLTAFIFSLPFFYCSISLAPSSTSPRLLSSPLSSTRS